MTRFALIVCALLLILGLGWYVQHMDKVHDWLRPLGRKQHPAADEVVVKQRTTAVLPGLDRTVKVRVDDIKRGQTADVEIIGPDSVILATKKAARVSDRIAFTHDGNAYEVEVIRYVDNLGSGDTATLRLIVLPKDGPPAAKVKNNQSPFQGTWKVEGAPGDSRAALVTECVIGQYDGSGHLVFVKKPGENEFQPIYELRFESAKPDEVLCFPGNGKHFPCVSLARGEKATITFPRVTWGSEEVTLTRINSNLHAEVQDLIKEWTPQWATIEGIDAIGRLEKRNRVFEKLRTPVFMDGKMLKGEFKIAFSPGAKIEPADHKDLLALNAITHLELARTELKDEDLGILAKFKNLSHLSLAHTSVTDAGLQNLNGIKRLDNLNLEGTRITDAGLKELTDLPRLETLNLNGCAGVTQAGVTDILKRLPKLSGVNHEGGFHPRPSQEKSRPPEVQKKETIPATSFTFNLKEKRSIPAPKGPIGSVRFLKFADDGKSLWSNGFAGVGPNTTHITNWWDVASGEQKKPDPKTKPPEWPAAHDGPSSVVPAVSSDGKYHAASTDQSENVTLSDQRTKKVLAILKHADSVNALAFSPDGTMLAVGTKLIDRSIGRLRGKITLWEVPTGKEISSSPLLHPVFALAYSPDGTVLASGHFFGDIKLWDVVKEVAVPPDPLVKDGPASIEGTWKVEGHREFQECVIGKIDGQRHMLFVKLPGTEAPEGVFILLYDPGEPRKVVSPFLGRADDSGIYSARGAEITIRFPNTKITLTRITGGLDPEMQDECKHMRDPASTAEGRAALDGLKKRKRNAYSPMIAGGGPTDIEFPAGAKIENADVKDITTIHGISLLGLAKTQVKDDDLNFVASFKRLEYLNLAHTAISDAGLRHLNGHKRIKFLNLQHSKVTDAGLKAMTDLPSLVYLDLNGCDQVTQTGITAAFRALPKLPGVKFADGFQSRNAKRPILPLRPSKPGSDQWNKALAKARKASGVDIALSFEHADVGSDADVEQLKDFAGLKASVIALKLSGYKITATGLKHLAVYSELELLSLDSFDAGDTGLQEIARLPKIRHLSLKHTKISDEGMKHLAGLTRLESVDFENAKISDAGIRNLAGSNLRRVNFGSSKQGKEKSALLRQILPKLEEWRFPEQQIFYDLERFPTGKASDF